MKCLTPSAAPAAPLASFAAGASLKSSASSSSRLPGLCLALLFSAVLAACGGGGGSEAPAPAPGISPGVQATITLLAGSSTENGCVDGAATVARFGSPQGIAVDDAGNVYVADAACNQVRKITPAGTVSTFTVGTGDLNTPSGLAISNDQKLYVSEIGGPKRVFEKNLTTLDTKELQFAPGISIGTAISVAVKGGSGNALFVRDDDLALFCQDAFSRTDGACAPADRVATAEVDSVAGGFIVNSSSVRVDLALASKNSVALYSTEINPERFISFPRAGSRTESGRLDGVGGDARFVRVTGVSPAPGSSVFVADTDNIRLVALDTMTVSTLIADLGEFKGTRQLASTADGKTLYYTTARGVVKVSLP